MQIPFRLNIQGVFLDSFIYSGILYLIHEDYTCRMYSWPEICEFIKKRNGFKTNTYDRYLQYIIENTNKLTNFTDSVLIEMTSNELETLEKNSFNLGFWPTDINLYANKFYYAGDDGVYYRELDYQQNNSQKQARENKISDIRCFNISPSYLSRISLAAGTDGVHTICHHYNCKYEKQISNENSIDIDWGMNDLFINAYNKLNIKSFESIDFKNLEKNDNQLYNSLLKNYKNTDNYEKKMLSHYHSKMLSMEPKSLNTQSYDYGWSSGDCDFLLSNNGQLTVLNKIDGRKRIHHINIEDKLLKVRTSGCGTVLESEKETLSILSGTNDVNSISKDFVSWRIYPRARTHSDHLHIINDDSIDIIIIKQNNTDPDLNSFTTAPPHKYKYSLKSFLEE